ncbi:MAG: double zinc ribbon domain-containing protein, partial [Clostridia bacterium]
GADLSFLRCERCGTESPVGTRFCSECGNRLE